ncbi:MAG: sulfite exporter TauE/SafE family protein [Pseudoruegeria sp.]
MFLLNELGTNVVVLALCFALFAGFVKGVVGFALPIIMVSCLGSIMSPELALAALILPTLFANAAQSFRQGARAAWESVLQFWVYITFLCLFILLSAQLVRLVPSKALYFMIGGPVVLFTLSQLVGFSIEIKRTRRLRAEILFGAFAGFCGGTSGTWGPPTVAFLTAVKTSKLDSVRIQGVIYGVGAVFLFIAHIRSGIFNAETAPLSALMLLPVGLGMWAGKWVQDRLNQQGFRTLTLIILTVAGLNLIRRGIIGL